MENVEVRQGITFRKGGTEENVAVNGKGKITSRK